MTAEISPSTRNHLSSLPFVLVLSWLHERRHHALPMLTPKHTARIRLGKSIPAGCLNIRLTANQSTSNESSSLRFTFCEGLDGSAKPHPRLLKSLASLAVCSQEVLRTTHNDVFPSCCSRRLGRQAFSSICLQKDEAETLFSDSYDLPRSMIHPAALSP